MDSVPRIRCQGCGAHIWSIFEPEFALYLVPSTIAKKMEELWGLLHDAGIDSVTGRVPGTVSMEISFRYLRQQFPGDGTGFKVVLSDCDQFVYQEYDSPPVEDFNEIVALKPEIVGVEKGTYPVVVNCVMGALTLSYGAASIHLDSGGRVSLDELAAASKAYWDALAVNIPQRR